MANTTSRAAEPKFFIRSARIGNVNYNNSKEIANGLADGTLVLKSGDALFLATSEETRGSWPEGVTTKEDYLEYVQTYAHDKYSQNCQEGYVVSDKITLCNTSDEDICIPFKKVGSGLVAS